MAPREEHRFELLNGEFRLCRFLHGVNQGESLGVALTLRDAAVNHCFKIRFRERGRGAVVIYAATLSEVADVEVSPIHRLLPPLEHPVDLDNSVLGNIPQGHGARIGAERLDEDLKQPALSENFELTR